MRKLNSCAVSALAILLAVPVASPAFAQETAEDEATGGIADIIVTAEKRTTNVQDVPISITAIAGEELSRQGVSGTRGLASLAPNVNIGQDARGIVISIRGISSQGVTFSRDPSIAFHVDGVYSPRPTGASGTLFDLDRVEILRGPQGTLYGRNATGGAVNVITAKPDFNGVSGYANFAYGNYNAISGTAAVNLPLIDDKMAFRIAATFAKHDPYAPNLASAFAANSPGLDDQDDQAVRAHLLFKPSDNLKILLSGDYQWQGGHGQLVGLLTNPARSVLHNTEGFQRNRLYGAAAEVTLSLGAVDIVSLTSVRRDNQLWIFDSDETATATASTLLRNTGKQFSQELRVVSTGDGPFKWIIGANYFKEINADQGTGFNDLARQTGTAQQRTGRRTVAKSVFGQIDYTIADVVTITGGLRYTEDEKSAPFGTNQAFIATTDGGLTITTFTGVNGYVAPLPYASNKLTWRAGIKWDVSQGSNVYASVVTGYKAGGVNTIPIPNYGPETLTAYEVGTKNRFANNTIQINASAFYYDYKGYQINAGINLGTPPVLRSVFTNAGAATVKGIEIEAVVMPSPRFRVDASFGFLDTKFDDLSQAFDAVSRTRVDMTGNVLPRAPKTTWRLSARYDAPLGSGTLTPSASINSQSSQFFSEFNDRVFTVGTTTVTRYLPLRQDGWAMVNASLRYEAAEGKWYVEAYGQNLGNKTVLVTAALNQNTQPGGSYAPPRTFGIKLGGKF
jgi:iron complex outermembrane recepter protein